MQRRNKTTTRIATAKKTTTFARLIILPYIVEEQDIDSFAHGNQSEDVIDR